MKIDIQDVQKIIEAHLRRGVANEAIALGKILADLAAWQKGETPPALRPPPRAAPFDVPPKVHTYGNPGDPGDGKLRIRKASRRPSDQDADDTVGVMQ